MFTVPLGPSSERTVMVRGVREKSVPVISPLILCPACTAKAGCAPRPAASRPKRTRETMDGDMATLLSLERPAVLYQPLHAGIHVLLGVEEMGGDPDSLRPL